VARFRHIPAGALECGAFPPLLFLLTAMRGRGRSKNKSGGKAPHSISMNLSDAGGASAAYDDLCPQIGYLAGRFRPAPPAQRQVLVGFVETLNGRPNVDNCPEGHVTLRVIRPPAQAKPPVLARGLAPPDRPDISR